MPTDTIERDDAPDTLERELAGLDRLELVDGRKQSRLAHLFALTWPKLAAIGIVLAIWQFAVWREWKPRFVLPSPLDVWHELVNEAGTADFWRAIGYTLRRAVVGYGTAVLIGGAVGILVTRVRALRTAIGSMITGLQTMPSVAWFPLSILLFGLNELAIFFVVILGAAPSIANGIISGIDNVPPLLRRVGTSMGAGGVALYRDVVVPASMPSVIAGLKQGWAFSWRSLMAGELLVIIPGTTSIGTRLEFARQFNDAAAVISWMVVIFVIGILVDALVFGRAERTVLRHRGLLTDRHEASTTKLVARRELVAAPVQR